MPVGLRKTNLRMSNSESTLRQRANAVKPYRCKNLIAVIENPMDVKNIGTILRNVNALGVDKTYIVDFKKSLPDDWQELRDRRSIAKKLCVCQSVELRQEVRQH